MAEVGAVSGNSSKVSSSQASAVKHSSAPPKQAKTEKADSPKPAQDSVKISKDDDGKDSANPVNLEAMKESASNEETKESNSNNKAKEAEKPEKPEKTEKTEEEKLLEEQKALEEEKAEKEAELEETQKQMEALMSDLEDAVKSGNNQKMQEAMSKMGELGNKMQDIGSEIKDIGAKIDEIKEKLQPPPAASSGAAPAQSSGAVPSAGGAAPACGGGGAAPAGGGGGAAPAGGGGGAAPAGGGGGAAPSGGGGSAAPAQQSNGSSGTGRATPSGGALDGVKPKNPDIEIPDYGRNPSKQQVNEQLEAAAEKYGIPPNILKAVAWQESTWRADASSYDGGHGKGIMQIDDRSHEFSKTDAVWDSKQNIEYGTKFLASLYEKTGDWSQALKRYNGGSSYPPKILALAEKQPWLQYLS